MMNSQLTKSPQVINSSKEILTRLKILLGVKSAKELASIFNLKPNTISSWKKRNTLCYSKLIQVCNEYGIDLNELFFIDYPNKTIEKNYINIPIIYINDYLEYYLSIEGKYQKLKQIYYPKQVCFDIVIQLYATIQGEEKSSLVYVFCKKVDFSTVEVGQNFVFLLAKKGFISHQLVQVDQQEKVLYLKKDTGETYTVKESEIIEVFQWIKHLPC
ncbi:helix-turn-helix domain-containing protein [Myroides fluvii]|uniref:helix-turn-helix domain-containing protein n=1 Tax=Myroides fluvii TaxID=2572594 RepID=UPI00131AD462|nr:helix-turn-helix domain-containing protein [Myroides fluvii]